ncbi:MAG: DUF5816 domain-containing protein [Salinigranum sp.]
MDTVSEATTHTGESVVVDRGDAERGSKGAFYPVYRTGERRRRWGYRCGNCGSFDVAVDTMGRVVCNECDNLRKPDEWDAAHE